MEHSASHHVDRKQMNIRYISELNEGRLHKRGRRIPVSRNMRVKPVKYDPIYSYPIFLSFSASGSLSSFPFLVSFPVATLNHILTSLEKEQASKAYSMRRQDYLEHPHSLCSHAMPYSEPCPSTLLKIVNRAKIQKMN